MPSRYPSIIFWQTDGFLSQKSARVPMMLKAMGRSSGRLPRTALSSSTWPCCTAIEPNGITWTNPSIAPLLSAASAASDCIDASLKSRSGLSPPFLAK